MSNHTEAADESRDTDKKVAKPEVEWVCVRSEMYSHYEGNKNENLTQIRKTIYIFTKSDKTENPTEACGVHRR